MGVLGNHIWQEGAQKGVESSRLDVSHYKKVTDDERKEIEQEANRVIMDDIPVEQKWMDRNEAEQTYGFALYQGGVPPGAVIRIVHVGADVQACAGTHMTSTGKVGPLRIVKTERIQDGVERFEFAAGIAAIRYDQERDAIINKSSKTLRVPPEQLPSAVARFFEEWKQRGKEIERLKEVRARFRFLTSEWDLIGGELKAHNKGEKVLSALEVKTKSNRLLSLEAELKELAGISVNVTVNVPTVGAAAEAPPVTVRIVEEMERGNDRIKILRSTIDADMKELLHTSQDLLNDNAVVILGGVRAGQAHIVITVRTDIAKEGLDAAMIVKKACSILGGNGGGRPERAQGGGPYADKINEAVSEAKKLVREKLESLGYRVG